MYNPNSGKGKINKKIGKIEQRLRGLYGEVAVVPTKSAGDMTARAREFAGKCDALIFAGGDGTFNAVLQGVLGQDVTLGYIPAGTVNDAAGNLDIPKSVRGALNVITRGRTGRVDCLSINEERCAFCIVAAGALTRVTYETAQDKKRRLGWLAYAIGAWKRLRRAEGFHAAATCGKERIEGEFALAVALNGRKLARFSVGRGADMGDGVCEAAFVRQSGQGLRAKWGAAFAVLRILLFGIRRGGKRVALLRGRHMTIRTARGVLWDFDGEKGSRGDIDVRVLRGAVKMFLPK